MQALPFTIETSLVVLGQSLDRVCRRTLAKSDWSSTDNSFLIDQLLSGNDALLNFRVFARAGINFAVLCKSDENFAPITVA